MPHGLYPIARHHLYNGDMMRPTFNSGDFQGSDSEQWELERNNDEPKGAEEGERKREKKKDKKSIQRNTPADKCEDGETRASELGVQQQPGESKHKKKNRKDKKNKEKSSKKSPSNRKSRKDNSIAPEKPDSTDAVAETMRALDRFSDMLRAEEKEAQKIRKAEKRKRASEADRLGTPGSKASKKPKNTSGSSVTMTKDTPQASLKEGSSINKKKNDTTKILQSSSAVASSPVKRTPVPLPKVIKHTPIIPPTQAENIAPITDLHSTSSDEHSGRPSELHVPETPPTIPAKGLKVASKTPIPFPPLHKQDPDKSSKAHKTLKIQSARKPKLVQEEHQSVRNVATRQSKKGKKLTQPLNDEPKPRPVAKRTSRTSSTGTSSRASSVSISDMFDRLIKAQTPSEGQKMPGEETKPFPSMRMREASMYDFIQQYTGIQAFIDFNKEQEYLDLHIDWNADNQTDLPLPCLGQATGCSARKEDILRLSKEEKINMAGLFDEGSASEDTDQIRDAGERTHQAEAFLIMAVTARVPVALGHLEGIWTLYCPQYSEHHVDKYGYGLRTLQIMSISGFKDKGAYMARLNIPPRPTPYSTLVFTVPPYASFRTTQLVTAAEGYEIDVVFLGNGYLQMRLDLNLLLRGKPTEMVGGRKAYMEFFGVQKEALKWTAATNRMFQADSPSGENVDMMINA